MAVSFNEQDYNVPMGRNIRGSVDREGTTLVLRIKLDGQHWDSNGPKHSKLAASSEGFVNVQGFKVGINVLAPKA